MSSLVKRTYFYFLQIKASQFSLSPFLDTCYACGFLICQCVICKVFLSYYRGPTTLITPLRWFPLCAMYAYNQKLESTSLKSCKKFRRKTQRILRKQADAFTVRICFSTFRVLLSIPLRSHSYDSTEKLY